MRASVGALAVRALASITLFLALHAAHAATEQAAKKSVSAKAVPAVKPKTSAVHPRGPEIKSNAVIVVDETDSSVLLSKNADVAMPIASITKLMIALVVLEAELPMDEVIKITNDDRNIDKSQPSRLTVGAKLTRGELLHLALMSSENRAANALGRTYEGGMKGALAAMNAKAKALGMKRTHFTDTTGLSEGNIASPEDLVKLVIATSQNEAIREYSTDPDEVVMVGQYPVEYRNTNNLVRKPEWDILVQKTGYTMAAGRCLVMKAVINERPMVMVFMNSFGKYTRTADAIRVRRWMETGVHGATLARAGK
jgi:D-alanyl-D-alanine endopeptidase (penicillin-binding protein 7)